MAGRTGRSRPRRGGWFLPSLHFTRLRRGEKKERRRAAVAAAAAAAAAAVATIVRLYSLFIAA